MSGIWPLSLFNLNAESRFKVLMLVSLRLFLVSLVGSQNLVAPERAHLY